MTLTGIWERGWIGPGFLALSIAIAAFQLVMDRGDRLDWLESPEIIIESCIAAFGLYVFVIHTLTTSHPFLPPRLLLDRNFSLGLCFVLIFGAISFVPMILIPPLLQDLREVPDSIVGIVLASRGIGSIVGKYCRCGNWQPDRSPPRSDHWFQYAGR